MDIVNLISISEGMCNIIFVAQSGAQGVLGGLPDCGLCELYIFNRLYNWCYTTVQRQSADEIFYCKWIGNTLVKRYQTHDKSAEVETRIFAYWRTEYKTIFSFHVFQQCTQISMAVSVVRDYYSSRPENGQSLSERTCPDLSWHLETIGRTDNLGGNIDYKQWVFIKEFTKKRDSDFGKFWENLVKTW